MDDCNPCFANTAPSFRNDNKMSSVSFTDNWRKRRWLHEDRASSKEERSASRLRASSFKGTNLPSNTHLPFKKLQKSEKNQNNAADSTEQFCQDCRRAVDGHFSRFPKLSDIVDTAMQSAWIDIASDDDKMLFVKNSDGFTKVVFSSTMVDAADREAILSGMAALVDKRTNRMSPAIVSVTDISPNQTGSKNPQRNSWKLPYPPEWLSYARMQSVQKQSVSEQSFVAPFESRCQSNDKETVGASSSVPQRLETFEMDGRTSASISTISRPVPLARYGSMPTQIHAVAPLTLQSYVKNQQESVAIAKVERDGQRSSGHVTRPSQAAVVSAAFLPFYGGTFDGRHHVYPPLRRRRTQMMPRVTGAYFVPSIPESLKEGIQPHVPSLKNWKTPVKTENQAGFRHLPIQNAVYANRSTNESSLQSFRDMQSLKPQNCPI